MCIRDSSIANVMIKDAPPPAYCSAPGHVELALHGVPDAASHLLLVDTSKCAMEEEDTLLLNEEDGDLLGLVGGIVKAIADGFKQSRHLPSFHGEMLGEKWVLGG